MNAFMTWLREWTARNKDIFAFISLLISISILCIGNNILNVGNKILRAEDNTLKSVTRLDKMSRAPVTEPGAFERGGLVETVRNNKIITVNIFEYNLTVADLPQQVPIFKSELKNQNSGYPTLLEAIQTLMGNRAFIGNALPLTIINAENLAEHGRSTNNAITQASAIDLEKLKSAIFRVHRLKNSGMSPPPVSFDDIVVDTR